MPNSGDPFRSAAFGLLALPLDKREAALNRLLDEHKATLFPPAKAEIVANTIRLREVWSIAAEIGVMLPPPLEH
jgi:hypothetical protein